MLLLQQRWDNVKCGRRFISMSYLQELSSAPLGLGLWDLGFLPLSVPRRARQNVPVVDIAGDGSFNMSENSLAVSVLENLPVIVILLNNYMLGMVAQWQRTFYNRRYEGVHLHNCPDYTKIADAYGAQGIKVTIAFGIRYCN